MNARTGRVGLADLPLHSGRAPAWLFGRMVRLAREVLARLVAEHGPNEVLERLSDPFWFQGFARPRRPGLSNQAGGNQAGGPGGHRSGQRE